MCNIPGAQQHARVCVYVCISAWQTFPSPPRSITASANARNKNEPKRRTIFAFYHSSVTMSLSKWPAMAMNEATAHARPAFSVTHPTWFTVVSAIDFEIGSKSVGMRD